MKKILLFVIVLSGFVPAFSLNAEMTQDAICPNRAEFEQKAQQATVFSLMTYIAQRMTSEDFSREGGDVKAYCYYYVYKVKGLPLTEFIEENQAIFQEHAKESDKRNLEFVSLATDLVMLVERLKIYSQKVQLEQMVQAGKNDSEIASYVLTEMGPLFLNLPSRSASRYAKVWAFLPVNGENLHDFAKRMSEQDRNLAQLGLFADKLERLSN